MLNPGSRVAIGIRGRGRGLRRGGRDIWGGGLQRGGDGVGRGGQRGCRPRSPDSGRAAKISIERHEFCRICMSTSLRWTRITCLGEAPIHGDLAGVPGRALLHGTPLPEYIVFGQHAQPD